MKKFLSLCFLAYLPLMAQSPDYYQSVQQLTGDELRNELHEIIKAHNEFSYSSTKNILRLADEDPDNENNVILVYKGNSISKDDFSTNMQQDFWNREHVWVKSQGGFTGDETYGALGAYSDAHNLKPCDASINTARGTKDFDDGGTQNTEATDCYSTTTTWEPRDEVKGDVARIIFYMATRYMGDPGEPSLNIVDYINNSSDPLMGKLSTLLQWNEQDPVDAFERRRNQVIFNWQQNRNPFIDYPELANLIWAEGSTNPIVFTSVELQNNAPSETESQDVFAQIFSDVNTPIQSVTLKWATSWADLYNSSSENIIQMTEGDVSWAGTIPALSEGTDVKYQITATADGLENTFYGNYVVALNPFEGTITSIQDVQGTGDYSPFDGQTISTKGVVTAVLGDDFYMQDGEEPRSGIYIYTSTVIPSIGDSVIVTGEVSEFQWEDPTPEKMTELAYPDQVYILNSNNPIPNPIDITTGGLANEDYEGMLVRVSDVTVTYADLIPFVDYGQWRVDDGSGECYIHNTQEGYEYDPEFGEYISSITGISTYLFGDWKISLRMEDDVDANGVDVTGPSIIETTVINETTIAVFFSENVEISSAENTANYSISNNIIVESASRHPFQWTRVNLTTSFHVSGNYEVIASNVMDEAGNLSSGAQGSYSVLGLEENSNPHVTLYPNPSNGTFYIEGLERNEAIEIVDILGKTIYQNTTSEAEFELNLKLKEGLYFLKHNNLKTPFIIK
ncbi:MAG: endonuclease [Flavobacteriaceae bacterium]|nr:endonuclease [Flavobacteriaceae bacterium]